MEQPIVSDDNKQYYLDIWKEMLGALLGWSESQVLEWAEETWGEFLDDPDDIFYHGTPQYWVRHLLIPDDLNARLSNPQRVDLQARILRVFQDEHQFEFPLGTDWRPFRAKIERILGEYGARLPARTRS
jgi:hypothetical protein